MSYQIVRGDLGPNMPITLTANGAPVDVSTATTVELHWLKPDGTAMVDTLLPIDASLGKFEMVWSAGDTDVAGYCFGLVVVTTAAIPETYPSDGSRIIWFVNRQITD